MIGDGGFVANKSSSFKLVHFGKKGADRYGLRELNVHFLDKEHFEGFDSQDFLQLGAAKIETRFCCISHWRVSLLLDFTYNFWRSLTRVCQGHAFDMADGIIGLGWVGSQHSPSIIKTLSEPSRPAWHIASQPGPLIKRPTFAFLAGPEAAEVHLGGAALLPATHEPCRLSCVVATELNHVRLQQIEPKQPPPFDKRLFCEQDTILPRSSAVMSKSRSLTAAGLRAMHSS